MMPRQTSKYVLACVAAGVPSHAGIPHEAVYGMMALAGMVWDGKKWEEADARYRVRRTACFRVEAHPQEAQEFAEALENFITTNGMTLAQTKGPYRNKENGKERFYVNFRYTANEE